MLNKLGLCMKKIEAYFFNKNLFEIILCKFKCAKNYKSKPFYLFITNKCKQIFYKYSYCCLLYYYYFTDLFIYFQVCT